MATHVHTMSDRTNGAAMAAIVGAGIGAFAVGATVILGEAGIWSAPALYPPAGGLSGRTTLAVLVWLTAWAVLHALWRRCDVSASLAFAVALTLVVAGVLGTFPPVWQLF